MQRFFSNKNATTLKWRRPDRWRFCAVILKRCREQHISPYAVSFFILTCFTFFKIMFLTCFSTKSTQAETIDLRVFYERRHSCFPFFFLHWEWAKTIDATFFSQKLRQHWSGALPTDVAFATSFWGVVASSESHRTLGPFSFFNKNKFLLKPSKHKKAKETCIPGPNKRGSLRRAKIAIPWVLFTFQIGLMPPPRPSTRATRFRLPDR